MYASHSLADRCAYAPLSKVAKVHLVEMVDPNYVVVAAVEKKFLPRR